MRSIASNLRGSGDFRVGMEKIHLYGNAQMTASAADDVVLVARSNFECMKLALDDSTCADGITIPDDVAAKRCRVGSPERDDDDIQVVLVRKLPVHLARERGVVVEV